MSHVLDPREIADDHALAAARRELDQLLLGEPLDSGGTRVTELASLIEDYEARQAGYDLAHMRRLLARS